MRVLVTGGNGFVGTHLVAHLEAYDDVVCAPLADVTDPAAVEAAVADMPGGPPEAVYHLAGQADVGRSWTDPSLTWSVNTMGTVHVLDALRRMAPGARILLVSSAEVYGLVNADQLPITEHCPTSSSSPYGASKIAAEVAARFAADVARQHVVIARPFNHLGVGQAPGFILPAVAKQIAEAERDGTDVIRLGNLDARRDMTDVADVVRAYRLLIEHGRTGETYNICTGVPVAIGDLVHRMIALSGREYRIEIDAERLRPSDVPVQFGDSAKLRRETGWAPQSSIDDVLGAVLDEWRARTDQAAVAR
jgi:GDP-4-dehydro-6-deoxy-D-mannose reductase